MINNEVNEKRAVKYQIFVSSTFVDLIEERKIAIKAILKSENFPIDLGSLVADDKKDYQVIENAIADCDFMILIIGFRSGENMKHDPTQKYVFHEYELAKKYQKPILSFILSESDRDSHRGSSPYLSEEKKHLPDFVKFIEEVQKHGAHSVWKKDDLPDLASSIALAISKQCNIMKDNLKAGWVKAIDYKQNNFIESTLNNEFYLATIQRLNEFQKLDARCNVNKIKKEIAAKYFCQKYVELFINSKRSIFFESGSSIAYVAKQLSSILSKKILIDTNGSPNIDIKTNNILAYLQLWLIDRIPTSYYPWGCPEEPYGASYGAITDFGIAKSINFFDKQPKYTQEPLDDNAVNNIDNLIKMPFGISKDCLMLGSISGVQFSDDPIIEDVESLSESIIQQIKECRGFHVGSYSNKIFKRYMYQTNNPLIIFVDDDKINCSVKPGVCHFVFDKYNTWENFINNYPLAFFIGCKKSNMEMIYKTFEDLNFKLDNYSEVDEISAVYAKNNKFPY